MILWALALFILACTGVVGYYQGALRAAFSFVGLLVSSLAATPVGSLFKSVLPVLGLKNPLYLAYACPVLGFILVLVIFKVAALAAHKKVEAYYRYKANDTQRLLFERMNTRVGIPVGLANGFIYVLAIFTLLYSVGYFTVQVATGEQDSWVIKVLNRMSSDLIATKVSKAVAPFMTRSALYYDAADVVADVFQTPLLQNRLANYPPLLLLGEKEDYKLLSNAQFQMEWIKGTTFGTFLSHDSVRPLVENRQAYTNVLALLGGEVKDLKTYLETGKSPKYDDEKILGRWAFDYRTSMSLARRRKPNMGSAEITRLRKAMAAYFKNAMVIATVDHKAYLRVPAAGADKANNKGTWRSSGSAYLFTLTEGGQKLELEASVEGRSLIFTKDGYVLVFENTRV